MTAPRHHAGMAAEEIAAQAYEARGGRILARRHRTQAGEIDLVVELGDLTVFVEVKQRRRPTGADSPVGARQWARIAAAAEIWLAERGATGGARFDAAILLPDGRLEIVEDAHRPGLA